MIIDYPTALYKSVIPQRPEDSGNVTWTISSQDPPRPNLMLSALYSSLTYRTLPPKTQTPEERVVALGELVFSLSYAAQTIAGTGKKQFEVGQILNFEPSVTLEIDDTKVPDVIDLQQNTNLLDLTDLGLTDDEVINIYRKAREKFSATMNTLNIYVSNVRDLKIEVQSLQASINEAVKAIDACSIVLTPSDPVVSKLKAKLESLQATQAIKVNEINNLIALSNTLYNDVINMKEAVR